MADTLVAATRIKHGDKNGKTTWFEPGQEVKGLPQEDLDALLQAGALKVPQSPTPEAPPASSPSPSPSPSTSSGSSTSSEQSSSTTSSGSSSGASSGSSSGSSGA